MPRSRPPDVSSGPTHVDDATVEGLDGGALLLDLVLERDRVAREGAQLEPVSSEARGGRQGHDDREPGGDDRRTGHVEPEHALAVAADHEQAELPASVRADPTLA
jgi:hypothetical protein